MGGWVGGWVGLTVRGKLEREAFRGRYLSLVRPISSAWMGGRYLYVWVGGWRKR